MARLDRRAGTTVLSLTLLCLGGGLVTASAVSATPDFAQQNPWCGPDPLTLIDPCEAPPPPAASVPAADQAQIPWDVIDSALFP